MSEDMIILPEILAGEDKTSPFLNCIRNNYRHLRKWAKRTKTNCFRIYDRHLHHYPLAIDFYAGRFLVHYFSRHREDEEPSPELYAEIITTLQKLFDATDADIFWRTRIRREKYQQYEKVGEHKDFFTVYEYGVAFKINLRDYLDTGLFLDHRETRHYVASIAKGKSLLNLFAYTGAFSVQAAAAGAVFTKTVDMSNTYTGWCKDNFILNGISLKNHPIVREDCLKFLDDERENGNKYDIIVIDPPTISRSKKMDQMFDIQEDYISLLRKAARLLMPGGVMLFSTNSRRFVFDLDQFSEFDVRDVSNKTLPLDFADPKIHRCWKITKK
jgi:23S rRNA G2069 N7-methylase RlmK/C1962 C5-methylase RlmI